MTYYLNQTYPWLFGQNTIYIWMNNTPNLRILQLNSALGRIIFDVHQNTKPMQQNTKWIRKSYEKYNIKFKLGLIYTIYLLFNRKLNYFITRLTSMLVLMRLHALMTASTYQFKPSLGIINSNHFRLTNDFFLESSIQGLFTTILNVYLQLYFKFVNTLTLMNSADKFITVFKSIIVGFWMIGLVGTWEKKLGWLILKGKKNIYILI